ncbi:MAG: hypothetical protein FWD48_05035 [Oscillospiraceae bacterium]|nr:hypothetical protein [Oscillospiraceae bacterium]
MSEYYMSFIPDNPSYKLDTTSIELIKKLSFYSNYYNEEDNIVIEVSDVIQFADCGGNLEEALCPFCKVSALDWWGDAMGSVYSEESGFEDLNVTTPCCQKAVSLNDLDYSFPQGFYKSIIRIDLLFKINLDFSDKQVCNKICEELYKITNTTWRVIHARY